MTTTDKPPATVIKSALDHLVHAEGLMKAATGTPEQIATAHAAIAQSLALASLAASMRGIAEALASVIAPTHHNPIMNKTAHAAIRLTNDRTH